MRLLKENDLMLLIETPQLILRNFCSGDAADLRRLIVEYSASPLGIYDHPWPTSEPEIQGIADFFAGSDQFLAVCGKDSGQFIGLITFSRSEDSIICTFDLGYIFHSDFWGKGYATESCQALIDHAFTRWEASRVTIGTAAVNEPSCRLLARLGFRKISESTGHFQVAPDGSPYEFLGYNFELTREAWGKKRAADSSLTSV